MRPLIALLSDFGSRDHYAGTMKGVMMGICPELSLVDITHEIRPHDVLEGALQLAAACRYFPPGPIFLAVVDPGVGSSRRGLAAEAGDYRFVAPDNGLLTAVFQEIPPKKIVELTERRYARPTVSRTFEGRDRFAPAAAWLAKGIQLAALGRTLATYQQIDIPRPDVKTTSVRGVVLLVDHFGNLVTNIDRRVVRDHRTRSSRDRNRRRQADRRRRRHLRRHPSGRNLRALRQHRPPRDRRERRQRRGRAGADSWGGR